MGTPASPPSASLTSGRSSPRCTTALPTESSPSGSRPTSEVVSPPDSPSSTTQWTLPRSSNPSTDSSDRELLRLRPRPAESREGKKEQNQEGPWYCQGQGWNWQEVNSIPNQTILSTPGPGLFGCCYVSVIYLVIII